MGFYNTDNWPEKRNYYRWPWSSNDNPVQWLETTDICNIHCKGCYRSYMQGHRPLEELIREVDFCIRNRNIDTVCIAGGEPLIYPRLVELVRYIAGKGLKANIITNCVRMTEDFISRLSDAGVYGFTCHVDMLQDRPENKSRKDEIGLMPLRQKIADMIYAVGRGKIYTTFNCTVYHENFRFLPDIVKWARSNIGKVHGLDFITYRGIPIREDVTWSVESEQSETHEGIQEKLGYAEADASQIDITSVDVYNLLKDHIGGFFEPCAYLGGTGHIKEYKWWGYAGLFDTNGTDYGFIGPRTMEFLQVAHHWVKGRYFMYLRTNRSPRVVIMLTALLGDKKMRPARRRLLKSLMNPVNWFRPVYFQSIGINQPPDLLENGVSSMCESCPDACVWEGNLVSSCRLDEYRRYGRLLNAICYAEDTDKRVGERELEVVEAPV